ncbi:MAG: S8 family peptidase [Chloroflexi bacterium]|nr:S8 family peptidase [Chloroflexota bacterium]
MPNPNKIHPGLAEQLRPRALAAGTQQLPIIVKYTTGAMMTPASVVAGASAPRFTYRLIHASAFSATPDAINQLSDRDDVEMIWFDGQAHTMLNTSVPLIRAPLLWQAGLTGKGIKVGVVDTGLDATHPDFAGRVAAIKDFTGEGDLDGNGHGTHVAGTIGGSGAASGGVYRGVAPECTLYAAKVLTSSGFGSISGVIAGVEWAVDQGVRTMNLSLGMDGSCDGTDALSEACDAAVARGVAVCVAAGNAGPSAYTVGSPGCAKNVITVGATTKNDDAIYFSSRGPTADGRIKPDLCFPGVDIIAPHAVNTQIGQIVNQFYTTLSGTSMATPHATGSCALLLQDNPTASPGQIKNLLMASAVNLGLDPNTQGSGRGDVFAAYKLNDIQLTSVTLTPSSVSAGKLVAVSLTVRNNSDAALPTQGPEPGFIYEEEDTFISRGFVDQKGAFRVALDFDGRTGVDHPYRWGLGTPLQPGETRTITGAIRLKSIGTRNFWGGLVEEQTVWIQDRVGVQSVQVLPPVHLVSAVFSPSSLGSGGLLNVSITVQNDGTIPLTTQGPDPSLVYEEGDTFLTRGYPDVAGSYRVGVDFDARSGIDHPIRWGLGAPLQPGETRTITGQIRLKTIATKSYWVGLVQEQKAWIQDKVGVQVISVTPPKPGPKISNVTFTPTTLSTGNYLTVTMTVLNDSDAVLATQGPEPGFIYEEGESFASRGFAAVSGNYRVGVDFDGRGGLDHPYRWGFGTPLNPGETRTISGAIHLKTAQTQNYWGGLVQEYIAWLQDRQGTRLITVKPGITITNVTFAPTTVSAGQLLNVSITVRNDSNLTLATQGPDSGFVYAEGDDFASRGFPAAAGNYRVGIDFTNRTGVDHPYRWGLTTPLAPGETRTITGAIRLQTAQSQDYWAGLVQEFVAWLQDHQGTQTIGVA